MNTLRQALADQLARYDDEAWAALANKGLLRRAQKDLEKAPVADGDVEDGGDALTVTTSGQRVRIEARGPGQATCTCPATGVCQHILAAAIGLQRLGAGDAPAVDEAEPEAGAAEDPSEALRASLLALPGAALVSHAGKPGYRWAWQFVQDLDLERDFRVEGDRHLALAFGRPRLVFRYMGGGLDALIADADLAQLDKYRVAAVLALRLAMGAAITAPEPVKGRGPRTASLDLGVDHAMPEEVAGAQDASRERLIASALQLLDECLRLGLSHLSQGMQERLSTLAVWAQGADLHRLSRLLRRLADHVELLLSRAGGADEHRLLDELALTHALVEALKSAAAAGRAPIALTGRARTRYEGAGALTMLGVGAHAWSSPAGYTGLTMIFWSPQERGFLSCTDARPVSMRSFNPISRYTAAGPWSGLGAPALATGHRVTLTGAQLNEQGRLSAAESTSAIVEDTADVADALIDEMPVAADWAELVAQYRRDKRSLLAEPRPMADWVVVKPARFGEARFLGDRQTQVWPLFDADDRRLDAELPYSERSDHAIDRIEHLRDLPPGMCVIGRLRPGATGLVLEPLSLIWPLANENGRRLDALHFDASPQRGGFLAALKETLGRRRREGTASEAASAPPGPPVLRELRAWLCRQAERGMPVEQWPRVRLEAQGWALRTSEHGFGVFHRALRDDVDLPALMLRWHYLLMQFERLGDHGGQGAGTA